MASGDGLANRPCGLAPRDPRAEARHGPSPDQVPLCRWEQSCEIGDRSTRNYLQVCGAGVHHPLRGNARMAVVAAGGLVRFGLSAIPAFSGQPNSCAGDTRQGRPSRRSVRERRLVDPLFLPCCAGCGGNHRGCLQGCCVALGAPANRHRGFWSRGAAGAATDRRALRATHGRHQGRH